MRFRVITRRTGFFFAFRDLSFVAGGRKKVESFCARSLNYRYTSAHTHTQGPNFCLLPHQPLVHRTRSITWKSKVFGRARKISVRRCVHATWPCAPRFGILPENLFTPARLKGPRKGSRRFLINSRSALTTFDGGGGPPWLPRTRRDASANIARLKAPLDYGETIIATGGTRTRKGPGG